MKMANNRKDSSHKPRKSVVIMLIGFICVLIIALMLVIASGGDSSASIDGATGSFSMNSEHLGNKFTELFLSDNSAGNDQYSSSASGKDDDDTDSDATLMSELLELGLDVSIDSLEGAPYVEVLFDEYVSGLGSIDRVRLKHKLHRLKSKNKVHKRTYSDRLGVGGVDAGHVNANVERVLSGGSVSAASSRGALLYGHHTYLPSYRTGRWVRSNRRSVSKSAESAVSSDS